MSKFVILLIVIIAVICSAEVPKNPDLPSGKECASGSSWKSQCNDCKCSNEGHALCTRAECTGDEPDPIRECAPNTSWKDDCNTCWCSDGAADCTLMECINFPIPKKSELLSGKDCAPGSYWKSQCNNCMCTDEGEVDCTRVECVGDEPDPIRHCAPDTVWKNDCNTCWCKGEGVLICSRRECVNITNPKKPELPSGKKCAVGSSWKSQCNNCRCSNDGYALCTYVECTGYEHEPERECAPDTRWKDDCNTCWCDNGTAACTRKGCINITGGSVAAAILG